MKREQWQMTRTYIHPPLVWVRLVSVSGARPNSCGCTLHSAWPSTIIILKNDCPCQWYNTDHYGATPTWVARHTPRYQQPVEQYHWLMPLKTTRTLTYVLQHRWSFELRWASCSTLRTPSLGGCSRGGTELSCSLSIRHKRCYRKLCTKEQHHWQL